MLETLIMNKKGIYYYLFFDMKDEEEGWEVVPIIPKKNLKTRFKKLCKQYYEIAALDFIECKPEELEYKPKKALFNFK
jgi:hypothetical protein